MKWYSKLFLLMFFAAVISCNLSPSGNSSSSSSSSSSVPPWVTPPLNQPPWDWNGIIGTGQSLAVGGPGDMGVGTSTTTQPYGNLKINLGNAAFPTNHNLWNPANSQFSMIPLVEPIRPLVTAYPSSYPSNIYGETPHTAMGDQISAVAGGSYVTVHTVVGEAGQPLSVIDKGATDTGKTGRAYAASIFEAQAITLLANAAKKKYGIQAVVLTHGESDAGNMQYEAGIYQLWSDYNTDLKAVTGQTNMIPMFASQQNSCGQNAGDFTYSSLEMWQAGIDYPGQIICTGPKYQYPYVSDAMHLTTYGYDMYGEKLGEIYCAVIISNQNWQPLQPANVTYSSNVITVLFNVPVIPHAWDTNQYLPHTKINTNWAQGRGFEVSSSSGVVYTISSVAISGNSAVITCVETLPASGLTLSYAWTTDGLNYCPVGHTGRSGQLCDSDTFTGSVTKAVQPNYCVAFTVAVPYSRSLKRR